MSTIMRYEVRFLCQLLFFFFKQKTAYEMRISDWSSDVCSSDLLAMAPPAAIARASPAPSEIANLEITLFILCSLFSVIFQIFLFLVEAVTLGHHCSALLPAHADPDPSSCRSTIVTLASDRTPNGISRRTLWKNSPPAREGGGR